MLNVVLVNQQESNIEMATMQWLCSMFLAGIYLNCLSQAGPLRQDITDFVLMGQKNLRGETRHVLVHKGGTGDESKKGIIDSDGKLVSSEEAAGEESFEDEDFVDEDGLMNLGGTEMRNTLPVTHLHREKGEILVPCFGMWWPVGGVYYDYGDYYGDYKKKKRARKQKKKAAKMKKKKA